MLPENKSVWICRRSHDSVFHTSNRFIHAFSSQTESVLDSFCFSYSTNTPLWFSSAQYKLTLPHTVKVQQGSVMEACTEPAGFRWDPGISARRAPAAPARLQPLCVFTSVKSFTERHVSVRPPAFLLPIQTGGVSVLLSQTTETHRKSAETGI